MPFDDFQKHCKKCKKGKPCGQFHVYVLTVDPRLKKGKRSKKVRFRKVNPDTYENGEALYVGKCECAPRCRQSKHRIYNSKKETKWSCYCGKYDSTNSYQQYRDAPTSIHDFLKGEYGYLQPKHFRKLNPFKPVSFKLVDDALNQVVPIHNRAWVKWLILAAAAIVILGGIGLFAYWYLERRTQATSLSAIANRINEVMGWGRSPLERNQESATPTAPPESTGAKPKRRASRAHSDEMEELIEFITRQPDGVPVERKAIEYRPYETKSDKGGQTKTGLRLDCKSEERRLQMESIIERIISRDNEG